MNATLRRLFLDPTNGRLRWAWRLLIWFASTMLLLQGAMSLAAQLVDGQIGNISLTGGLVFLIPVLVVSLVLVVLLDGRPMATLGLGWHRAVGREVGLGLLVSAAMIGGIVAVERVLGWLLLSEARPFGSALGPMLVHAAIFAAAALAEELLLRGYLIQTITSRFGPGWALGATSVAFGLIHAGNPAVTPFALLNIAVAGVWLGLAYVRTRSLWLPWALHTGWNWTMAALFGLPVSGITGLETWLRGTPVGPVWLTGGAFGPEGGTLATVALLLSTLWLARTRRFQPAFDIAPRPTAAVSAPAESDEPLPS